MKKLSTKNFSERLETIEKDFELLLTKLYPNYEEQKVNTVNVPEFSSKNVFKNKKLKNNSKPFFFC